MKASIKNNKTLLTLAIIIISGSIIYFGFASQLIKKCYNSDCLILLEEIIEKYDPLPVAFYPKLILLFLIGLNILFLSVIARIFYPDFIRKHIDVIVPLALCCHISCQMWFNDSICFKLIFIALIILLGLSLLQRYNSRNKKLSLTSSTINLPRGFGLFMLILFTSILFFYKFPITKFKHLIFEDDYPKYLYFAKYQLNILTKGALFGWNDYFSGGYPSFLDLRLLGPLFLPFAIFGDNLGFHIMIYVSYVSLPILIYWLSYQLTQSKKISIINGFICSFAMLAYFGDMFAWGLLPGFISIGFLVLSLNLLENFFKRKRFSLFLLALVLGLMFYIHMYTFTFTICFILIRIIIEKIIFKNNIYFKKLVFASFFLFFICLPFLYPLLKYSNYIVPTYLFSEQNIVESLTSNFTIILKYIPVLPIWLLNSEYFRCLWMVLPIAVLYLLSDVRIKKSSIYFIIFFLLMLSVPLIYYIFALEIKYLAPVFISLISGVWVINKHEKFSFLRLIIILLICSYMMKIDSLNRPIEHIQSIAAFKPRLVNEITKLDGNLILLENSAGLNPYKNFRKKYMESDYPHFEGILGLFTNKKFLSHYGADPYPYFKFREGLIVNGVFQGQDIQEADVETIIKTLKKWGIRYIVLWSDEARKYFEKFNLYFEKTFHSEWFSIFRFKKSDGKEVIIEKGTGKVITLNPFRKQILLYNVTKKEQVTIKRNYFPAWKAFYFDKEIKLYENNGQISFHCPEEGNLKIDLYFPKYSSLLIISLLSIVLFFYLELKNII